METEDYYRQHKAWTSFRKRKKRYKDRSRFYKAGVVTAGVILTLGGVLIAPLPGPGPVILIPLGLSLLALQFEWAEHLLAFALKKIIKMQERASNTTTTQRIIGGFIFLACAIGGAALAYYYVWPWLQG